jgi:hypothetical protein
MPSPARCRKAAIPAFLRHGAAARPMARQLRKCHGDPIISIEKFFWRQNGLSPTLEIDNQQLYLDIVATLTNVNALQQSIAQAQRQVQRDVSQVQEDSSRLSASQAQLSRDQRQLQNVQQEGRAAQARVNTQGQTIGKLINTTA